jgi:uncharacterized protein (TIGR00369 family)
MPPTDHPASPFDDLLGVRLTEVGRDRVVGVLEVSPKLHQPHGILHGGVYATLAETVASYGGNTWLGEGHSMGVSNHTDFLRSVTGGTLTAVATPIQRGRTLQLWQVEITDDQGRVCAHAKVKLFNARP